MLKPDSVLSFKVETTDIGFPTVNALQFNFQALRANVSVTHWANAITRHPHTRQLSRKHPSARTSRFIVSG
jgi:hypothetical protein